MRTSLFPPLLTRLSHSLRDLCSAALVLRAGCRDVGQSSSQLSFESTLTVTFCRGWKGTNGEKAAVKMNGKEERLWWEPWLIFRGSTRLPWSSLAEKRLEDKHLEDGRLKTRYQINRAGFSPLRVEQLEHLLWSATKHSTTVESCLPGPAACASMTTVSGHLDLRISMRVAQFAVTISLEA
ncbi:hypothetical protein RRG08_041141 [Elysia crispata]|uniref:Uncharacterized protein n=1 Tax=Elysia crispata TaxID=231223 RepID=A0AAE0XYH8_9GAST|nr:hypothetical protein RRG08_041141 [Elysia crispata]